MSRNDPRHALVRAAFSLKSSNLGQRVASGASFTLLGISLRTILTIGSMAILARLLTPADFGYIAMAAVVTELAGLLGSFGFSNILVQRRIISRLQLDTVFWAAFGLGIAISALVFGLSFLAEYLFDDGTVGDLLRILCLTFIFGSLSTVHEAILSRLMRFKTEFYIQISTILIRSATAIMLAYMGFGLWSLVAGSIAGSIAFTVLMLAIVRYIPRLRFNAQYILSTWKTSSSYMGNTVLYYINMNVDLLMIGRQFGATHLGQYQNARSLTDEVRGRIAMPLQRVLFPAFSTIQNDIPRLQQSVIRSGRLLAAIIFPIGIGLSAIAPELVPILYGEQWLPMIPILSLLGISAALRGSTAISSPLFNSRNQVGLALRYNTASTLLFVASILASMPYGLNAVALAISANSIINVVIFRIALGLIGLKTKDVAHILAKPMIASIAMWASISSLRSYSDNEFTSTFSFLAKEIAIGAIIYIAILHSLSRQYMQDFRDLTSKLLIKR